MDDAGLTAPEKIRRVRDIMIPLDKYPWVRLKDTLGHALTLMRDAHLEVGRRASLPRVLLVFNHHEELVGIVRRRDIMRGLESGLMLGSSPKLPGAYFDVGVDHHLTELSGDLSIEKILKGLRKGCDRPVSDVARPISTTLKPNDQIIKAVFEMVSLNESLIAVVEDEEILGVVRSVDVLYELADLLV